MPLFESCLLFAAVLAGCVFGFFGWWLESGLATVLAFTCLVVIVLQRATE